MAFIKKYCKGPMLHGAYLNWFFLTSWSGSFLQNKFTARVPSFAMKNIIILSFCVGLTRFKKNENVYYCYHYCYYCYCLPVCLQITKGNGRSYFLSCRYHRKKSVLPFYFLWIY